MFESNNIIEQFLTMIGGQNNHEFFEGVTSKSEPKNKINHTDLNNGYELREIEGIKDKGYAYSHLYKNNVKISDKVFREPGLSTGFKDGYCYLIHCYGEELKKSKSVIVNSEGQIVLSQGDSLDYPRHIGGNIGEISSNIYDLRNGEIIMRKDGKTIKGENYLIVGHEYSWDYHKPKFEKGVYQIDLFTCEVKMIDTYKRRG